MKREALRDLLVGPIATVPTPFDDDFEVDHGRMRELTQWWMEGGLVKGATVLKVAAALGEGPMLSDEEWPDLLRTVVRASNDRATVVCGLHYKDTKRTIEDAKRAQDLGAIGLQVCPPVFNLPSQQDVLDYFNDLSDAIDIGIMVYHTHWLIGGRIETDTFVKMADFENVVAVKWSNPEDVPYEDMTKLTDVFNVIDNSGQPALCHRLGGRGYINDTVPAYPPHDLQIWELLESGDYDAADTMFNSVWTSLGKFSERIGQRSGGQSRLVKGLMEVMGQPTGPPRPPSRSLNEEELAELRHIVEVFGWPVARGTD